ncbi:MAG TPA: DegT/DnrJ/EryC1/StrS family aminotransferase [Candidatus Pacearchaeota archaeon]|nr:DegT/DnrJ/EryC1/StrS family aminotransferase [Candidatus Pacearchaeota archaeon]
MIKFHADRNILFSEVEGIVSNKEKLISLINKEYSSKEITLTNYGRTAFQLILDRYNLKNCRIMIPAFICSVFVEIFKENNITPVLIDVEKDTFNISPRTLRKGYDKTARALIVNHMNGLPCEVELLKKILNKNQILIEDCAHSLGAVHNKKKVGTFGDASFFSLYKSLPSISGGFALTSGNLKKLNSDKNPSLLSLGYYLGKNANFIKNFKRDKGLYEQDLIYENIRLKGISYVSEKIASYYFKNIKKIIISKRKIAKILRTALDGKVELQADSKNEHVYTYFSFLLPKEIASKRLRFLEILRRNGVIGRIIWNKPLNNYFSNQCPNAKEISERIVGVPLNYHYSIMDSKRLATIVQESLRDLESESE